MGAYLPNHVGYLVTTFAKAKFELNLDLTRNVSPCPYFRHGQSAASLHEIPKISFVSGDHFAQQA